MEDLEKYGNNPLLEINEIIEMKNGLFELNLKIPATTQKAYLSLIQALKEKPGVDLSLLAERITEAIKTL